jgi:hypothetical protein
MRFPFTRNFRVLADSVTPSGTINRKLNRDNRGQTAKAALPMFEPLEDRTLMSTYYVSSSGNDSNSGTSSSSAWHSISKVNSVHLNAGDTILFQGGQTFGGGLKPQNGGNSSTAINFGSYGSGRATIKSGGSDGFYALSKSGFSIQNLIFVGSPNGRNHDGIRFESNSGSQSNFTVNNCDISGYGAAGVRFMGDRGGIGMNNVTITNNTLHDNVDAGVISSAASEKMHHNIYIAHNDVYNNYGDGSSVVTGSGLELGGLNGATIERNSVHDNGGKGGQGGCGVWCYESTGVTFQYNESYRNHTTRGHDGDGFDFDEDTSNSVMQYNYSHDNDGAGFMYDQWKSSSNFTGNKIRYNISQNDARKNSYASFASFGQIDNSLVYNNVFFLSVGSNAAIRVKYSALGGSYVQGLHFSNNIIETTGGQQLLNVAGNEIHGGNITFVGNTWYAAGHTPNYYFGNTYTSLSGWQNATGQEKLNGKSVGLQTDPKLNAPGSGGTVGASNLYTLSAYRLQSASPLINHGVSVSSMYGASGVSHDFFGDPLPQGGAVEIGVDEYGVVGAPPADTGATPPPVSTGDTGTLPTGWSSQNIGSVGQAGSSSYTTNGYKYTISGGGSDIYGTSDSFRYSYTTLSGDGSIVAKIDSMSSGDPWAKAGVMIRNGTAANAAEVGMLLNVNHTAQFSRRTSTGGSVSDTNVQTNGAPEWVKLVRSGNTFFGYVSSDGSNWKLVEQATVSMGSDIEIGLAVTAHNNSTVENAVFSNVTVVH